MTEIDRIPIKDISSDQRPPNNIVKQVKSTLSTLISVTLGDSVNNENIEQHGMAQKSFRNSKKLRSKEAFRQRVKSFTLNFWCGKPLCLSPLILAQYGWVCIAEDVIKCCSCSSISTVRLPWADSTNYQSECLKARERVVDGHMKICSWPSSCSSDSCVSPFDLDYLGLDDRQLIIKQFKERAVRLLALGEKLPFIGQEVMNGLNISSTNLSAILKKSGLLIEQNNEDNSNKNVETSAVVLSLCGWDARPIENEAYSSLFCEESGRSVGIWNFISVKDEADEKENDGNAERAENKAIESDGNCETPAKKLKTDKSSVEGKEYFIPLNQHHIWSPWVTVLHPASNDLQNIKFNVVTHPTRVDKDPGWKVVKGLLLGEKTREDVAHSAAQKPSIPGEQTEDSPKLPVKTPPRAAVHKARRMLREWSSASSL